MRIIQLLECQEKESSQKERNRIKSSDDFTGEILLVCTCKSKYDIVTVVLLPN